MARPIEIQVHTSLESLEDRVDEWRQLAVDAGSMFLTPEWASGWFEIYGDEFTPSIRCVLEYDRLVAVLPMMKGLDGSLRFVGDGAGDIFAPLLAPDAAEGSVAALAETLTTHP